MSTKTLYRDESVLRHFIIRDVKEKLMKAAIALFKKKNYKDVSINQICERCGVTKGSFYHHFSSKEDLLIGYYDSLLKQTDLEKIGHEDDDRIKEIFELVWMISEPLCDLPADAVMALLLNKETALYSPESHPFHETKVYKKIVELCRLGQAEGQIRDNAASEKLIDVSLSVLSGNIYSWCLRDKGFDLKEKDLEDLCTILKR